MAAIPEQTHGRIPDEPASPRYRRKSALVATFALVLVGIVALVGAFLPYTVGQLDAMEPWALSGLYVLGSALAFGAAWMELARARRAETVMALAVAAAVALTWASVTNGWYLFSPFQVGATLFAILALAHRAIARDETLHVSYDEAHGAEHPARRRRARRG